MNARKTGLVLGGMLALIVVAAILVRNNRTPEGPEKDRRPETASNPTETGAPSTAGPGNPRPASTPETEPAIPRAGASDGPPVSPERSSGTFPTTVRSGNSFQHLPPPVKVRRAGTATITGTVKVAVRPPAAKPVDVTPWPHCAALYPAGLAADPVLADPSGRVRWAMVRVRAGVPPESRDMLAPRASLTFSKCRYRPRVLALRDTVMLAIGNDDPVAHHYVLTGTRGSVSHHAELKPGEKTGVQFAAERDFVRFSCRLHPWEIAWVGVAAHPFHFVTGPDGEYGIADLPPGRYTLEAWHEAYRPLTREITVVADRVVTADFTFDRLRKP